MEPLSTAEKTLGCYQFKKNYQSITQIYLLPTNQIPEQQFVSHLCCLLYMKYKQQHLHSSMAVKIKEHLAICTGIESRKSIKKNVGGNPFVYNI